MEQRSPECGETKRCLKEINPIQFPGMYWGTPWRFQPYMGCCSDCQIEQRQAEMKLETKPTKLRLMLLEECEKNCEGCCNKNWNIRELPVCLSYDGYEEVLLTGGEPMLEPEFVEEVIAEIRQVNPKAKVYLYTAKVEDITAAVRLLNKLDGMTVTLHTQGDVDPFAEFVKAVNLYHTYKSLRLNVFKGVDIRHLKDLYKWCVKSEVEWIKNCPLPSDEVFMRF